MKLNINKDALVKHKFWIGLLLAVPMTFAGLFLLLMPIKADIDKKKAGLAKDLAAAKKVPNPLYGPKDIKLREADLEASRKEEYKVWGKVSQEQAAEFFWPTEFEKIYPFASGKFIRGVKVLDPSTPGAIDEHHYVGKITDITSNFILVSAKGGKAEKFLRSGNADMPGLDFQKHLSVGQDVEVTYQSGRYFNDKLHEIEQNEYTKTYISQIRPILDIVDPVNEDGDGVVLLRDYLVPKNPKAIPPPEVKFLRFVPPPWKSDDDISEESWIAQEDLWIQKDFYRAIRDANDQVGKMQGKAVKGKEVGVFRNPYFELTLKLVGESRLSVSIKNLQNHRQKLEVHFRVRFDESAEAERIFVDGEPLDPVGTTDDKKNPKDVLTKEIELGVGPPRTGIYSVSQMLTWETAAVRRIDQITIGSLLGDDIAVNHRMFPDNTRTLILEKKDEADPNVKQPGGDLRPGIRPGGGGPIGRPGGGAGGGGGDVYLTKNGLDKNRYVEVNDQSRRLPAAIAVIVDQDHIDRVISSFANSKFRFLLNQIVINRYPNSLRPNFAAKDKGPGFGPGFGPLRGGGGDVGGGAFQPGGQPGDGGGAEIESNVELVLYGVVTLYERFPQRKLPQLVPEKKE